MSYGCAIQTHSNIYISYSLPGHPPPFSPLLPPLSPLLSLATSVYRHLPAGRLSFAFTFSFLFLYLFPFSFPIPPLLMIVITIIIATSNILYLF